LTIIYAYIVVDECHRGSAKDDSAWHEILQYFSDRNLVIEERTGIVAKKISEFLKGYDRFAKTIVFCVDIDHAERMRSAFANHNADLVSDNYKYILNILKKELPTGVPPEIETI